MEKITVLVKIQEQEINPIIDQKLNTKSNINKINGLIWGECADVLYFFTKGEGIMKISLINMIWFSYWEQ